MWLQTGPCRGRAALFQDKQPWCGTWTWAQQSHTSAGMRARCGQGDRDHPRPSKPLSCFPKDVRTIICIERQKPVVREKVPPSKPWQHLCFLFSLLFKFSFFFSSLWPLTCSLIYLFPLSFHTAPLSKTHCRVLHSRSGTNKPIPTPSVTIHQ